MTSVHIVLMKSPFFIIFPFLNYVYTPSFYNFATDIFLLFDCLRRESNFLASARPITALFVCSIICA